MIIISQFSFFSHFKMLFTYYCDTQKQSSGEFAKFLGKQLCRSLFVSKVAGPRVRLIKKETPIQCSLRTLPEDCCESRCFLILLLLNQFFIGIPEIIGSFSSNRALFAAHIWFSNYEAKACWQVQQTWRNNHYIDKVFMQE